MQTNHLLVLRIIKMKKTAKILTLVFAFFITANTILSAEEVLILPVNGVIDLGLSTFIKKSLKDAEEKNINTIILEMDTPGGRVDAADMICTALLDYPGETVTYVINQAWSAGSMIALATDRIIMSPASSIGSAEPRMGISNQELKDEKITSALRARFKAIAEAKNHNTALAQGMVDKDLAIKYIRVKGENFILTEEELKEKIFQVGEKNIKEITVISEPGKLLNLSAKDAIKYSLAEEKMIENRKLLLEYLNKAEAVIIQKYPTWSEDIVRFLTHPIVSSLLLGIGFWAIILALRIPGLGLPEAVGVIFLMLFFWGHKLAGLAEWIDLILILTGVALILVEILILPGFGFTGAAGIILLLAGIILTIMRHPIYPPLKEIERATGILLSSFLITACLLLISLRFLPKTGAWKKLILNTEIKSELTLNNLQNKIGTAISDLRPSGKAEFDQKTYSVQTDGEFIKKGEKIKVVSQSGNIIKVRKV